MTRQGDLLAAEIVKVGQNAKRAIEMERPFPAMVTAVDVAERTITFEVSGVSHTISAVQGVLPEVGHQIMLAMNGTDAIAMLRPGVVVEGGWFSSNFVAGESGWGIDAAGNCEFNNATLRGDLTFLPDELIANGNFDTTIDPWTDDGATDVTVEREDAPPGGGEVAFVWKSTANGEAPMAHPAQPAAAGKTYRLSASILPWALAFSLGHRPGISLRLRWLDDDSDEISESASTPVLPFGAWTDNVAFSAIAPAGTAEVVPLIVATNNALGNPAAYVDNVSCVEASKVERGHLEHCTGSALRLDDRLDVAGHIRGPRVGVMLTRTTNVNINHLAEHTVTWENEIHNSGEGFWTSGSTVTIPEGMDGLYAIALSYLFTAGGSYAAFFRFTVRDFGHSVLGSGLLQSENGTSSFTVWLAAGDTLTTRFINASGAVRTLDTVWLQMIRLATG